MAKVGSFTDASSDQALAQIKENRALILSLTETWALDKVEEEAIDMNPMVKIENGEQLTANDLRGRSLPELKQVSATAVSLQFCSLASAHLNSSHTRF